MSIMWDVHCVNYNRSVLAQNLSRCLHHPFLGCPWRMGQRPMVPDSSPGSTWQSWTFLEICRVKQMLPIQSPWYVSRNCKLASLHRPGVGFPQNETIYIKLQDTCMDYGWIWTKIKLPTKSTPVRPTPKAPNIFLLKSAAKARYFFRSVGLTNPRCKDFSGSARV